MNAKTSFKNELLVLVLISFVITLCLAVDVIKENEFLSGDQTIISANGLFELGFFKPGNSSGYYIGIWYKIPIQTIVWVANRNEPVSNKYSSSLKISRDGNLVLISNMSNSPIWSTYLTSNISEATEAVLLGKGNLVLRGASNSTPPLWQSFDYPTDTLLPGAKLGFNKKTGLNRVLNSWKSSQDPATGLYTQEFDYNSKQIVLLWNKSKQYWNSGVWIPEQNTFSHVFELRKLPKGFSYNFVDNENETYEIYDVSDPSLFLVRQVVGITGQARAFVWFNNTKEWVLFWSKPEQQCNVHASCGAFSICNQNSQSYCQCLPGFRPKMKHEWNLGAYTSGCTRKTKLNCENPGGGTDRDKFLISSSVVLPEPCHFVSASSSDKCQELCLRNCSCSAYSYNDNGCLVWLGDLFNVKQVASTDASKQTLSLRLAASEIQTSSHQRLVVGISVSLSVAIVILLGVVSVILWRNKKGYLMPITSIDNSLTRFGYRDLHYATKNFSHRLGRGGFGSIFKGTLPNSTVIAVKKLERIGEGQEKEFRTEVSAIATIQHVNLVRLCGFCSEGNKRLLVYEYMPNGSLNTHLFRKERSGTLRWELRYKIAVGIAKGLAYLHEECRDCIIHCDIKPENILLDEEFRAKVADFGMAKLLGREFSRVRTTIRGTRGYLAPEWIQGEAITAKVDVYSYGMMLFELISGRRNIQQTSEERMSSYFPYWALMKITRPGEDVLSIIDPKLDGNAEKDEVMRLTKLACWCIQDEMNQRPTMGQVVQVLDGILDVDMPSLPLSFQFLDDDDAINGV